MNEKTIKGILRGCGMVRSLIKGRIQVKELIYVNLTDYEDICKSLREAEIKLDCKIMMLKSKINSALTKLDGYDPSVHKMPDYISEADLEDGFIDISPDNDDKFYLNLITGEISSSEEIPEDKRSR